MTAVDHFSHFPGQLDGPAQGAQTVTPSDSVQLTNVSRALYVGGTGNVKVTFVDGSIAVFVAVPVGTVLPARVKLVWSTGTTATSILALY